ncbi:MAG: aldehyde dehydrogenase family protein [Gammaproteobacteria bacterium]
MTAESINPAMGETIRTYTTLAPKQIEAAIQSAHEAFTGWRDTTFGERARAMGKAAELLKADGNRYARMMAKEMGKPIRQGEAEIKKCASVCDYYAENATALGARAGRYGCDAKFCGLPALGCDLGGDALEAAGKVR